MKQAVIICVLLLGMIQLLAETAGMDIGGFVGINGNTYYDDSRTDNYKISPSLDFHLGSVIQAEPIANYIVGSELLYMQKGAVLKFKNSSYSKSGSEFRELLRYIQLGAFGKMKYSVDMVELQPAAGFYLAYQIGAKHKNDQNTNQYGFDLYEATNKFDLGLSLGADAILMKNILVGGRMEVGLIPVFNDEWYKNDARNLNFRLYVGYLLSDFLTY